MTTQNQDFTQDTIEYMRGGRGGGRGGHWGGHGGGRWTGHGGGWGNNYYGNWGNYGGIFNPWYNYNSYYPWYSYNAYYPYGMYSCPVTTEVVQQNVVTQNLGSCVCTLDEKDPKKLNIINQCINGGTPVPVNVSDQCQCQCQPQQ
jgi:hypothetical protein